ncbi:MAG: hypothetical protein AAFV72_26405, partial [Cyanobacteria bacterium J06635_1]
LVPAPTDENSDDSASNHSQNSASFVEASNQVGSDEIDRPLVVEQRSVEIIHQESVGEGSDTQTRALVRGTLQPGEQVVTGGVHRLVNGQAVQPIVSD